MADQPHEVSSYRCPNPRCFGETMVFPLKLKEAEGGHYYEANHLSCRRCGFQLGVDVVRSVGGVRGNLYQKQKGIRKLWIKSTMEHNRARNVAQILKEGEA